MHEPSTSRHTASGWSVCARVELIGERLRVEAPPQARGWIQDRFARVIQACIATVLGPGVARRAPQWRAPRRPPTLALRLGRGTFQITFTQATRTRRRTDQPKQDISQPDNVGFRSGPLGNPKLTFDQFVIGDSNRLAHAAALTVAEMPAQAYNPLFICGPPGVGKTHLLSSIATLLLAHNPGLIVRCTTGEEFTNEFLGALVERHADGFKASFRQVDVLLVDDVQFLERKAKTEEEFFHTFNALYDAGRQIVLTSDRPPRDLQALEDRLRERFEAGLVADIKPPELATRLAILRKRAHHDGIELGDPEVLPAIAERVTLNVRALEGALIRIVAFSSLTGRALTAELAREVLDGLYPASAAAPSASGRGPSARSRRPCARTSASPPRSSSRPPAQPASPGRGRWRCTSRASSPASRCRRSAGISAGAITRRSSTPADVRARASSPTTARARLWRSCAANSAASVQGNSPQPPTDQPERLHPSVPSQSTADTTDPTATEPNTQLHSPYYPLPFQKVYP